MALDVSIDQASEKLGALRKKLATDGIAILTNISNVAEGINSVWKAEDISKHLNRIEELKYALSVVLTEFELEVVNLNNVVLENINDLMRSTSGVQGGNINYIQAEMQILEAKTYDFVSGNAQMEDNWKEQITKYFSIPNDYKAYEGNIVSLFGDVVAYWKRGPEVEKATEKYNDFMGVSYKLKIELDAVQSDLVTLMANYSGH